MSKDEEENKEPDVDVFAQLAGDRNFTESVVAAKAMAEATAPLFLALREQGLKPEEAAVMVVTIVNQWGGS